MDWTAVWLTLKLATCTTAILFVVGLPLACWLATTRWRGRFLVESVVAMPLVLPPTVFGFYLLVATGSKSPLGQWYEQVTGSLIPFTFSGILLGSVLYNLPFTVRPFTAALEQVNRKFIETSWSLGVSRWRTFWRVTFPLSWSGILVGMVLTFAHCIGEFGIVLMIGGNIPGVTRTLSIAIYDDVQALDYQSASQTALLLVIFSLIVLTATQYLSKRGWPI
ncbi:MAG TPA: molybdate ABC transporter permease subunit [Planctomicrobium sp.]|nr:molybdate ABC transporter permease subunit [Planctomicrobium sp.]